MNAHTAYVHDETADLLPFVVAGIFIASDVQVARAVVRRLHEADLLVLLAVALSVKAVREGQVCLLLDQIGAEWSDYFERSDTLLPAMPTFHEWMDCLTSSRAVQVAHWGPQTQQRPLVLDGHRLYLNRYWHYEVDVAHELSQRVENLGGLFHEELLVAMPADDYFGVDNLRDPQRLAVFRALTRRLTVISGGPGTGKTRTIALLIHHARSLASRAGTNLLPALAAPTATAAKRMTLALAREDQNEKHNVETAFDASSLQATTLHRLLGVDGSGGYTHNCRNPLPHDLVVVDEASMVSLPLFARLLDAIRPDASLVLVGDPFQLESVEAGAVLGEIVGGDPSNHAIGPMRGAIVRLEKQHRFRDGSPVDELATAIRNGMADAAIQILTNHTSEELEWIRDNQGVEAIYQRAMANAIEVIAAAREGRAEVALENLTKFKIICATRHGHRGVLHWSSRIEQLVRQQHPEYLGDNAWYVGRPIIVNRNDYLNQLFNGDSGVVVDRGKPVAAFNDGEVVRTVPLARLRDIDTWWAMTIHKSQGSEFESVIVSLPEAPSPVLSRELLYTAVTRAKRNVSIVASEESLRAAIDHPSGRSSGLSGRLWGQLEKSQTSADSDS